MQSWEKELITGSQTTLSERKYKTPLDKIPYKFSYVFVCDDTSCKGHDLMIEDWELCQLYRSLKEKEGNDAVLAKIRQKYFDDFVKTKNLHLILGTESQWNNWIIIGVYYPKK